MLLISREKIVSLVASRKLDPEQIKTSEIRAAQFRYIRGALKEDLYEQIIDDQWSTDPDFTISGLDTNYLEEDYSEGLIVQKIGGAKQGISGISRVASAVITISAHGYSNGDLITISGTSGNEAWDRILLHNTFKITEKEDDTFELTTNIVNQYLKEPLAYYVFALAFYRILAEASEKGIQVLQIERGETPDADIRKQYQESLVKTADSLMGEAVNYIEEQDYDEYEGSEGDEDDYTNRVMTKGNEGREVYI